MLNMFSILRIFFIFLLEKNSNIYIVLIFGIKYEKEDN